MLIYAGIDEAGYGPMLGPLCVGCSVFCIADHDPDTSGSCDLWKRLNRVVCRKKTDKRRRIAIEDSKKLKGANNGAVHPLKHLERGILSLFLAMDGCVSCDGDLFKELGVTPGSAAWFQSTTPLPVAHTADELRIAASRLRQTLLTESITCEDLRCEAIDAASFNAQVEKMGTKSSVNFCAVLRHIDAIWNRWPNEHPRVIVDRQGGRTHYMQDLMHAWPDARVQIIAESENLSRYRLERSGSMITLSFQVEGETHHLPVALASMIAKYVRELLMMRLNRYFQTLMPELKPTAGYTEDARRYLADIDPLIARLGVDRRWLVRSV